jgi:ribose-phosphate pyrophosphokinase
VPYNKTGAPLSKPPAEVPKDKYTFESVPATPGPGIAKTPSFNTDTDMSRVLSRTSLTNGSGSGSGSVNGVNGTGSGTINGNGNINGNGHGPVNGTSRPNANYIANGDRSPARPGLTATRTQSFTTHDLPNPALINTFQPKPGYKRWVAQAGTLVANLLTCAGADQYVPPGPILPQLFAIEVPVL